MESPYLYLLLVNIGWAWCSYQFLGKRYTPALAWYTIWGISLTLLAIGDLIPELSWGPISHNSFIYLAGISTLLFLGSASADIVFWLRRNSCMSIYSPLRGNVYNRPVFVFASAAAVVLTIVYVLTQQSALSAFARGAFSSREALGTMSASIPGALAIYISLVLSPISFVVLIYDGRKAWWMLVPIVVVLIMAALSVAKFALVFCCLLAFNIWNFSPKKRGSGWRRLAFPVALVLVLAGLVVSAAHLRGNLQTGANGTVNNPAVKVVYDYATGYIPAFAGFYDEYVDRVVSTIATAGEQEDRVGSQTFAGIYRLLSMVGLAERSSFNHYDGAFNVYTLLRDLIVDFGVAGSFIAVLLIGFGSQFVFRLFPVSTYRGAVINGLVFTQMQFSLMYSLFGFIFYSVCLVVSPFLVRTILLRMNPIAPRHGRLLARPNSTDA